METFEYIPKGVCSRKIVLKINDNTLEDIEVVGGCPGNLQGIRKLISGMDIDTIIEKLDGVRCGMKPTSCPDQIANALKEYKKR